jgi:hypothetical protein
MVRYYKHKEDPNVAMHMRFYDQFHNLLPNVIELDPDQDNGEPNGKRINREGNVEDCFYANSMVEVDSIVNPSQEHLEVFRTMNKARHFSVLPHEERQAMVKDMIRQKAVMHDLVDQIEKERTE